MYLDPPATIAILGAGPIGLEAALYARFLGYDVIVFERGEVVGNVRKWGHVRMLTPFGLNRSSLGLSAVVAHDENYFPPADERFLTGREWADDYLLPLAQTDLLADRIRTGTTVLSVGREGLRKGDLVDHEDRGDYRFRLLVRDAAGLETVHQADAVIDATGVLGQPKWAGQGGIPAIGEQRLHDVISYYVPDILGRDRAIYAQRRTLVIGNGHSAATTILALSQLGREMPGTHATWMVGSPVDIRLAGPVPTIENDSFEERVKLVAAANACAMGNNAGITFWPDTALHAIRQDATSGRFIVELIGEHAGTVEFDQVIANVGYRPDNSILEELQISPQRVTSAINEQRDGHLCPLTSEPYVYVLGAKTCGRNARFLFSEGLTQIRDLFRILGDRTALDLYASAENLPQ